MRKREERLIITFSTTAEAMAMEQYCRRNHIPGRLIPVPAHISAGCGLAWAAPLELQDKFLELLRDDGAGLRAAGVYRG